MLEHSNSRDVQERRSLFEGWVLSDGRGRWLPLAACAVLFGAGDLAAWFPTAWARPPQEQDGAFEEEGGALEDSDADRADGTPPPRAARSAEELIAKVRGGASTRGDALRASPSLVDELYEFLDAHPKDPRSGEIRALAAQLLMLSGDRKDAKNARDLWAAMVKEGPTDGDRAPRSLCAR